MRKNTIFLIHTFILFLIISCNNSNVSNDLISKNLNDISYNDSILGDSTLCDSIVKDSIDLLVESRQQEVFTSSIFAKIRFGESERVCTSKIDRYNNKFERNIVILDKDDPEKIRIGEIRPSYYNDRLYKLELFFDDGVFGSLACLFTKKYGETKNDTWKYKNVEISIYTGCRRKVPSTTYAPSDMYWDTYGGGAGAGSYITKDPYFVVISYINYDEVAAMEKDKIKRDSIQTVKENLQRKRDIKKAYSQIDNI